MTRIVQRALPLFLLCTALPTPAAFGQAVPNVQGPSSYQGFHLPTVGGTLSYSVTLSGDVVKGIYGSGGTAGFATISGNLALLSGSQHHPFSMVYSGGYFANLTGDAPSSVYQNLALSQVLTRGRWTYTVSDAVSYLPQTATTGLSGVPGVGDTGTAPIDVGTGTGQSVLTTNQSRVINTAIGSAQRRLTPSTSVSGTASYSLSRFLDTSSAGSSLNSNQYTGGLNLSHRLDARTTLGGSYSYFHIAYPAGAALGNPGLSSFGTPGFAQSLAANSFTFDYSRLVSRRLSVFASAGPQWTSLPAVESFAGTISPARTTLNATIAAGGTYTTKAGTATLSYARGTNAGSGVVTGASTDSFQANAGRRFTRVWNGSVSLGYSRSSSLLLLSANPFTSNTLVATGQVNRAIGRHLSAFGSYTAQRQSTQGITASSTVFSGLSQTLAAGLTYSPGIIGHRRR